MTKSKEQSAIDAIYEILDKMDTFSKRLVVVEDNLKILSNKVSKLNANAALAAASSPPTPTAKDSMPITVSRQQKVEKLVLGNIKLYGYIVNKAKVPIQDVLVNVYDESSDMVKSLKTDSNGYWEARLPEGRFGVEYIHKNFKPINKTVELNRDKKEYEVR